MDEMEDIVAKAMEAFDAREKAREDKANAEAEAKKALKDEVTSEIVAETVKGVMEAIQKKEDEKSWKETRGEVHTPKKAQLGSGGAPEEGPVDAFSHWVRTGDDIAAKAELTEDMDDTPGRDTRTAKALAVGSGSGSYVVPAGHAQQIFAARDAISWPRAMGVRIFNVNTETFDIPAETSTTSLFAATAEAGTYTSNDPTIGKNRVTLEKWTRAHKLSEELLADENSNILDFLMDVVGREIGLTESYYAAIGSGTSQHEGIFEGGDTDALTFNTDGGGDSDGNLTADALHQLYFTLGSGYRRDAAFLAGDASQKSFLTLRHTSANPNWAFQAADNVSWRPDGIPMFFGHPFFAQADIPAKSTGVCFVMCGSPAYYALVNGAGGQISMRRNEYLFMNTGQVGFYSMFRQSGKVLNANAWVGGVGA